MSDSDSEDSADLVLFDMRQLAEQQGFPFTRCFPHPFCLFSLSWLHAPCTRSFWFGSFVTFVLFIWHWMVVMNVSLELS